MSESFSDIFGETIDLTRDPALPEAEPQQLEAADDNWAGKQLFLQDGPGQRELDERPVDVDEGPGQRARELGPHALEHYSELKTIYYATG